MTDQTDDDDFNLPDLTLEDELRIAKAEIRSLTHIVETQRDRVMHADQIVQNERTASAAISVVRELADVLGQALHHAKRA